MVGPLAISIFQICMTANVALSPCYTVKQVS
jgi:hypothetical protein